ncbi:hypothetical protein F4780DRAFT_714659 [Xylariomycetidae sp. FL0641]|nr:hypothetical protein F4780DRAFT_714659 [Xylariomycetidae sp. FL0641]
MTTTTTMTTTESETRPTKVSNLLNQYLPLPSSTLTLAPWKYLQALILPPTSFPISALTIPSPPPPPTSSPNPTSRLLSLPPELLLAILAVLAPESVLALALTCKPLCAAFFYPALRAVGRGWQFPSSCCRLPADDDDALGRRRGPLRPGVDHGGCRPENPVLARFLALLERDEAPRAGRYLCAEHLRLHAGDRGWGAGAPPPPALALFPPSACATLRRGLGSLLLVGGGGGGKRDDEGGLPCAWRHMADFGTAYRLRYPHARAVVNQALFPPPSGTSSPDLLATLALSARHAHRPSRCALYETWTARIHSGGGGDGGDGGAEKELLLRGSYVMSASPGTGADDDDDDAQRLRRYVDGACFAWICPHLCTGSPGPGAAEERHGGGDPRRRSSSSSRWRQIPEVRGLPLRLPDGQPQQQQPETARAACAACLTDYEVSLVRRRPLRTTAARAGTPADQAFVRVDFYKRFGACRDPGRWSWRVMTEFDPHPLPARHRHHAPGEVRRMWDEAGGGGGDGGQDEERGAQKGGAEWKWAYPPDEREACKCGYLTGEAAVGGDGD